MTCEPSSLDHQPVVLIRLLRMNWRWNLAFVAYGDVWRRNRRLMHEQSHIGVAPKYQGIQLRSARKFLGILLGEVEDISGAVRA
jgi:hypothetical protein